MNKVEKLKEIAGKKIAIWCDTKENDEKFCKIINEMYRKECSCIFLENVYYIISISFEIEVCSKCEINDYYSDYQIIPFNEFFKDKQKSIGDYTLKELKLYCLESNNCSNCKLQKFCREYIVDEMYPGIWEFEDEEKLQLTSSEIEILKAIKVLYRRCHKLIYNYEKKEFTNDIDCGLVKIGSDRLPSLSHDKEYNIDELLEGVE